MEKLSSFEKALDFVLYCEGGYVNDPRDLGGKTNWGLSVNFLKNVKNLKEKYNIDIDKIEQISKTDAEKIYCDFFWNKFFVSLANQKLVNLMFAFCVHKNPKSAVYYLQASVNSMRTIKIAEDGILGPKTIVAANELDQDVLMYIYAAKLITFYSASDQKHYIKGWIKKRVIDGLSSS